MPCCLLVLALAMPRLAILLVVFFSDWLGAAFSSNLWPLLGFFFAPLTTLTYAWAIHAQGSVDGLYLVAVVVALSMDFGLIAGHARGWRNKEKEASS